MKKDIVNNAIICLSNMKIEDMTYQVARDIVLDELEEKGKEIERLNNIINELEKWLYKIAEITINIDEKMTCKAVLDKLNELKGDSSNE